MWRWNSENSGRILICWRCTSKIAGQHWESLLSPHEQTLRTNYNSNLMIYLKKSLMYKDSFLEVETGDITLSVPPNPPFRWSFLFYNFVYFVSLFIFSTFRYDCNVLFNTHYFNFYIQWSVWSAAYISIRWRRHHSENKYKGPV